MSDRRYDAVILDLFGTLVDFMPKEEYDSAYSRVASILSVPDQEFRQVWSSTTADSDVGRFGSVEGDFRNALQVLGVEAVPEKIERAIRLRSELYKRYFEPRDGALETLAQIRSKGLKVGVVTVCGGEIPPLWDDTAFAPLVDTVVFSCKEGLSKPDPRIYLRACENLAVDSKHCLYVGDGSCTELAGAAAVGMHPVLIKRGYKGSSDTYFGDIEDWDGPYVSTLPELLAMLD